MDHAWYVRDVHEMRAWRRIGAVAWSFALAALFALAYITLTSTPTLRASAWATRLGVSLAFAATQLPPAALVAAMLRPSLAPLRVAGGAVGGGVDPWGVFAPPGSEARWAGARVPKHLFPAAFAASRWVSHTPPDPPPDEIARDALGLAALLLSHVAAGAAACALLATAARGGGSCCDGDDRGDGHHHHGHSHTTLIMPIVGVVSTCALRAARYGAALGAVAAAHWVRGGARLAAFAPVARPRLYRVKRAVAPACVEGGYLACVAAVAAAALTVLFPMADERFYFFGTDAVGGGDARQVGAIGGFLATPLALAALAARFAAAACGAFFGALSHAPLGAAVAANALASRAAIETILTERYRFLPQSLDDGAAAACAPLLVSLVNDAEPWAQSLAFLDLCEVCENAHGEGNAGRFGMLLPHVTGSLLDGPTHDVGSSLDDAFGAFGGPRVGSRTRSPNGDTHARAVAAALAPVLSVASATRAALDAAERAEREAAGRGVRIGRPNAVSSALDSFEQKTRRSNTTFERRPASLERRGKDGTRLRRGSGFAASREAPAGTAGAETLFRHRASFRDGAFGDRDDGLGFAARPETSHGADERDGRDGRLTETSDGANAFRDDDFASTRAGDATASAAWAATADEWGMPSAVAPAAGDAFGAEFGVGDVDASRRDGFVFAGTRHAGDGSKAARSSARSSARELTRGFVEDELARRAGDSRRARDGAARARSLSRQMETPCAAAAREAKGVLAAHGQLARWGARAATSLACAGCSEFSDARDAEPGEDAFARSGNPNAAAVLRVLVAAARAAEACAAAGGGAPSSAAASSGVSSRCRVPELRDARAACAALADTFRACVHAFAESFGAEETRRMLGVSDRAPREGEDAGTKTDAMDGVSFPEEDGSAPRELVATLETILRSGEC